MSARIAIALFAVLLLAACGPDRPTLFAPDGSVMGTCDSRWEWCLITEADGGSRVIGAP